MSALLEIADCVEALSGTSREVNARVACIARGLEPVILVANIDDVYGKICDPTDSGYGSGNRCSSGLCYARFPDHLNPPTLGGGTRGNIVQGFTPAAYTGSLDAIMTLMPTGLVYLELRLFDTGEWGCDLELFGVEVGTISSVAKTRELAALAAALRARHKKAPEVGS